MRIFFTLILCIAFTFTHTHTSFELTPHKAAGAAIITVVAGGILYLVKTNIDQTQLIAQQATEKALLITEQAAKKAQYAAEKQMRQEALQKFENAFAQALIATRKIKEKLQSANSLQGGTEQDPVTFQDLEALLKYGQAMERLQMLGQTDLPKISPDWYL